ncbi:MAG: hypothetical protein INR71_11890, partial [Terriglobus roseus]|nr:hypothetical protein [Terriglobus roseus]
GQRGARDAAADGEGWSTVSRRRSSHNEEGAERWRKDDKDRELGRMRKARVDEEAIEDQQPRRNGYGRGGGRMGAWRDEQAEGERDTRPQGGRWRDREERGDRERDRDRDRHQNRDRERERDWTRGHKVQDKLIDEEPEWMSEPVIKPQVKEEKTQEDFERWKAEQRAKSSSVNMDKDEVVPMFAKESKPAEQQPPKQTLNFAGFGTFGNRKQVEIGLPKEAEAGASAAKPAPLAGLGKASKFGALFQKAKEETPTPSPAYEPEPPQQPPSQPPGLAALFAQPPQAAASPSNGAGAGSSKEDAEGFQRILQMLGGAKVSSPQPSQGQDGGASLASALFPGGMGMGIGANEPAQRLVSGTSRPDSASLVNELLARHTANRSRGPQTAPADQEGGPQSQYFPPQHPPPPSNDFARMNLNNGREENMNPNPNPRTGGLPMFSPSMNGTQARGRPETPTDQKRDFLLKLIEQNNQKPGSRPLLPQQGQGQSQADFLKQAQLQAVTAKGPGPQQHMGHGQPMYGNPAELQARTAPSAPPGLDGGAQFHRGGGEQHEMNVNMQAMRKNGGRPPNNGGVLPAFFDEGPPAHEGRPGYQGLPGHNVNHNIPNDPAIMGMPNLMRRNTSEQQG